MLFTKSQTGVRQCPTKPAPYGTRGHRGTISLFGQGQSESDYSGEYTLI